MKIVSQIWIFSLAILGVFLMIISGCKKTDDNTSATSQPPVLSTGTVNNITETTATVGVNITSQGNSAVSARGVCWSISANPSTSDAHTTDGSGTGSFTSNIIGLTANTHYYVRAYATNNTGTGYGNQQSFTTQKGTGGTVTDIDGNVYHTVTIGTQTWMVENLKTTKYNDGTAIPYIPIEWSLSTTPAYCWYMNDAANKNIYGALYKWYAVNTGKLAPVGWHVPTDAEWTTLINYLGGETVAGGKMKSTGNLFDHTGLWYSPNTGATNESGFTALPAGGRGWQGNYDLLYYQGIWWSSSDGGANCALRVVLYNASSASSGANTKNCGFSVRCLRD